MEFVDPVILNQRPGHNRPRHASEHRHRQQVYVQDANGLLVPATTLGAGGQHRSYSTGGQRPASIVIDNHYNDYSPQNSPRRRSHHDDYYGSDSWDDRSHRSHSHERHRPRPKHHSRSPSPMDPELERRLARLDNIDRKEEEERLDRLEKIEQKEKEERWSQKMEQKRINDEANKARKRKEEEELKKHAIEEYRAEKQEKEKKEKKEKEDADKAFNERVRSTFGAAGYDEASIEKVLKKEGKGKLGHGDKKIIDLTRPTYIKVNRKHLSPETLDLYQLPWEWDDHNENYIIIKRWIPEHDQDVLFAHTRRLREGRMIENRAAQTVELKRERDQLLLVRKKSPSRARSRSRSRSYILT